jgi:hypothetical protein
VEKLTNVFLAPGLEGKGRSTSSLIRFHPGKRLINWILRGFRILPGSDGQESNPGYPAMNIITELSSLQNTLTENTKYWFYSIWKKKPSVRRQIDGDNIKVFFIEKFCKVEH